MSTSDVDSPASRSITTPSEYYILFHLFSFVPSPSFPQSTSSKNISTSLFLSMLFSTFILAASAMGYSAGSPLPQGTGTGADSCKTDPLTGDTWKTLDIDTFLKDVCTEFIRLLYKNIDISQWTAANVTKATTNNIQALSASFGAPNFFCGLDQFCNADQPCLPVTLPAW